MERGTPTRAKFKGKALENLHLRTLTYKLKCLHCIVVAHYVLVEIPYRFHLLLLICLDTQE